MDVPLYGDNDEEFKNEPTLKRSNSLSNNFNRVTLLTRKASNLLDQEQITEIEISEILLKQGFSQEDVERVQAVGAKDIHQAIDLLTEAEKPQVLTPKGGYDCLICQADVGNSRVILFGCDHVFCESCVSEYVSLKVNENKVLSIRCPQHKCQTILSDDAILKYLTPSLQEKYKKFRIKAELSKDPHLRWCPRPNCEGYCLGSSSKKHLTCTLCLHEYCYYCSEPWHGDSPCKEQGDQLLDAWARENNVRYCPNCRFRVEKMMGCSHMACIQCQYQWCWLCGEQWSDGHFATCSEFRRWWQNPPIFVIILCLAAPFSMVFLNLFVLVLVGMSLNEGEANELNSLNRHKCLSYITMFIVSCILSPIFFVVVVVGVPIYLAVETCKNCNCSRTVNSLIVVLMMLYIVLLLIALIIGSLILMVSGVVMIGTKTYLEVRKCFVKRNEHRQKYNAMW
eukprot:CAMPEP_0204916584 /NCGR_PEP_ID=MMETSP1397-20131031/14338_1 /ASSEMBLY_ACC=CAM_ASM_000891 /TAXON_ID=49980 /ORGANISM="Climacostomum Climacostomum virens, Strain Stock W-24" /LENGTH=451 /DNA_ID=CAMNT_0052089119 /DNA_START=352 /DNA_END=1710 /DNA_ORIENTATION=-